MQNSTSCFSHVAEKQFAEAIDAMGHASGAVSKFLTTQVKLFSLEYYHYKGAQPFLGAHII